MTLDNPSWLVSWRGLLHNSCFAHRHCHTPCQTDPYVHTNLPSWLIMLRLHMFKSFGRYPSESFIKEYSHCRQITRLSLVQYTGSPIVRGIGMHACSYKSYIFKEGQSILIVSDNCFFVRFEMTHLECDESVCCMYLRELFIKEYPHCRQITRLSLVPHTGLPIVRGIGMHFADNYHINFTAGWNIPTAGRSHDYH